MIETVEQACDRLGLDVSMPIPPIGTYAAAVEHAGFVYTSGVVALKAPDWELLYGGRFGVDLDVENGYASARAAMVCTLANLRGVLGTLDRIDRFVKVTGYIQSDSAVVGLPKVLDGATDLLRDIFGDGKLPARSAIGVYALPGGSSVELECVVALRS